MNTNTSNNGTLVMSYLGLRKAIGIIGMLLPFVVATGKWLLQGPGLESSISAYYHTIMRDVFVGSMCAMAVFFMSYRYQPVDAIAGKLACVFALGVALFPVSPLGEPISCASVVHTICAVSFFLTLAFFSLVLFRKTDPDKTPTARKLQRNQLYALCGYTILVCVALATLVKLTKWDLSHRDLAPEFWLETVAIMAFGLSWLTKGETILRDKAA